jgi:NAD+ diphosphatase
MSSSSESRPNFYASGAIDRLGHQRRDPDWLAARLADPASRLVPVWRSQNLVADSAAPMAITLPPDAGLIAVSRTVVLLGEMHGAIHFAVDVSTVEVPAALPALAGRGGFADLRSIGPLLAHDEGALLAYARGLLHWHARHGFCGVCGSPTESVEGGHVRRCLNPSCGAQHFPRTDPAVIMLVHDGGDRVVLGRQTIWPPGMHSVLAGFVEPGESLEDAVRREVEEEIGVRIGEVRYHSSQPWPFPASIMLGFTARALGGNITVDAHELETARWYSRAELLASPEDESFRLPRRDSIARRLIGDWLAGG